MVMSFSILSGIGYHLLLRYSMVWYRMKPNIGFKIKFWARQEGEGCIVIRRRPITQSKIFILKPIVNRIEYAGAYPPIEKIDNPIKNFI
jgi:hypothetical protein